METVAVIGLGTMGLGIAQLFAQAGFPVLACDAHAPTEATALPRLAAALEARVRGGKLSAPARDAVLDNIRIVALPDLGPATLAIEAIVEDLAEKQALFGALESILGPGAILASNTSSLAIARIAEATRHPARLLGLHFFNPAPLMRLVELIPHAGTDPEATARARRLTEATGKTLITAPDTPGFIVNRCARPYYGEALALLEEGAAPAAIDAAMLAAGYRMGPFALIDLIGADINLAATESLHQAMGGHPRYHPFAALRAQVAAGRLGQKSGAGFLDAGVAARPDPALALRIEATLINEAAWLLAEGSTTGAIDTALKLGLNFPRGPFEALQAHGRARVLSVLAALEAKAPPHLKARYLPAPALEQP